MLLRLLIPTLYAVFFINAAEIDEKTDQVLKPKDKSEENPEHHSEKNSEENNNPKSEEYNPDKISVLEYDANLGENTEQKPEVKPEATPDENLEEKPEETPEGNFESEGNYDQKSEEYNPDKITVLEHDANPVENTEQKPDETPGENLEQKPEVKPEETPDENLEQKPEENPEGNFESGQNNDPKSEEKLEENTEQKPEKTPGENLEQKPEIKPEETPDEHLEQKPEKNPEIKLEEHTGQKPKEVPQQILEEKLEQKPNGYENINDTAKDIAIESNSAILGDNRTEVAVPNMNNTEEESFEEEIWMGSRKSNLTSIVSLRNGTKDHNKHFCAGSIISATTILTAAHCMGGKKKQHIWIVPGVEYIDDANKQFKVKKLILHPYFGHNRELFDVGLIILSEPLPSEMTPLELADFSLEPFYDVKVHGWGRLTIDTASGLQPKRKFLHEITMRTVGKGHCERSLHYVKTIQNIEMCVESPFYDKCVAESGGPVIFNSTILVGLVSYGVHVCVRWKPDVYLQIKPFVKWIKKNKT